MVIAALSANMINAAYTVADAQLSQVVVMTSSGLQYPFEFIGYSADEPVGMESQLTPLGQRQHFLIGSELRTRYVDEAKLLNSDYLISQCYVQVPQWSTNIQSIQAQMMGLYPASTMNGLNEWQ